MKLLYLTGSETDIDTVTTQQLARIAPQLSVTTVASAAEALVEIRRMGGFHALLTSPSLARNETLALITSLRTDRVPIAIVPVIGETQQDFLASAIGAGADDVLVLRGDTLVQPTETLTRIRQSPHLFPSDDRRLRVLYAGTDPVVWDLLEQMPFVRAERAVCSVDGGCSVRVPGAGDGGLRCDVVLIDEKPNDAHPLQVVKSVKAQASDLSVVVLSPPGVNDISTAAFDLGADDAVLKTSAYRRRLVATLRRVHQRLELSMQHATLREREGRLRQIVETMPEGLTVISGDGAVLAMNAAGLSLVGATRPREVVGRDFCLLVVPDARTDVRQVLEAITAGDTGGMEFDIEGVDGVARRLELRGVRLERDARGGSGVIATLRPAGAGSADLSESAMAGAFERERALESALSQAESRLRELDQELRDVHQHRAQLDAALVGERGRWDTERAALEARHHDVSHAAAAHADLESALQSARAELDRARRQHDDERATWEEARASLELQVQAQTAAAARAKADAEAALVRADDEIAAFASARAADRAAHEEAHRALEARMTDEHARARAEWDTARRALEDRLSELRVAWDTARQEADAHRDQNQSFDSTRAGLESALSDARREAAAVREEQHRARTEWDEAREYLEGRCADLLSASTGQDELRAALDRALAEIEAQSREASAAREERAELDATLEAAQGLLRQTTGEHKAERARWEHERRELESRLQQLGDKAQGRDALDASLAALRAELQQAHQTLEAERAQAHAAGDAWQTERGRWQSERAGWDAERTAWESERARQDEERRGIAQRLEQVSEAANGRAALEAAVEHLQQDLRAATDAHQEDRARHATERAAWDAKRRELEARLSDIEAVAGMRLQLDATLESVRSELRDAKDRYAAERADWDRARQDWDRVRQDLERQRIDADRARGEELQRAEAASRAVEELRTRLEALEQERARVDAERASLERSLSEVHAAHEAVSAARTAAFAESAEARRQLDDVRAELDTVQRKLDQEHTRRTLLEAAIREARKDAEGRLAAVEAEFASARRAFESELADRAARLEQLTEETRVAREQLETRTAAQLESYDRLLANPLFGHAVTTPDGLLIRCNDTFARFFGYLNARDAQARTAGRPFPALAGRAWLDARLAAEGHLEHVESTLERIDGRTIRVLESAVNVTDTSGQQVVERTLVDRTGSFAQDERLRQANRLEEIGTLVAAMAPDIESLLTSVVSSGTELSDVLPASDARHEHTARILSHAAQAGDLVRQLAAFSVKHVRPAEPVDLADAVHRAERVVRPLLGPHVGLKTRLNRTDAVSISQDDLDQLLSALVVAGRDLLPIGGTLTIETARVEVDASDADASAGLRPGAHLQLTVTASGYGVQAPQRTASLEAVASRCGGHLRVAGDAGRSASLRVYFPRWPGLVGPMA